jgi:hypothetical protein
VNHEYGTCLSFEEIDRYITNLEDMTEDEIYIVSYHLGHCEECADRARALRMFDFLYEECPSEIYGLASGSIECEKKSLEVEIIKEILNDKIMASLRVIANKPGTLIQFLTEKIEALTDLTPDMNFVAYAGTRGGGGRHLAESRAMAVSENGEKVLLVSGTEDSLTIKMEGFAEDEVPRVFLIAEGLEPLAADIKPDADREGSWSAVFTEIPRGDYVLAFKSSKN